MEWNTQEVKWQPCIKHDKKNSGANAIRNLQHWKTLCCVLNAAQGFFPFLAVLCGIFDALYAGRNFALHRIGRYVAKPQKVIQNRAPAARYRKSRNSTSHIRRRQILHESGKHWFFSPNFKPVLPENLCKSDSLRRCSQFYSRNCLDNGSWN